MILFSTSSPPGLRLLSMDAQWMLKGCSMDAERVLNGCLCHCHLNRDTKSVLETYNTIAVPGNSLQRYKKNLIYANFL